MTDGYIDQGTSALISVGVSTLVSYLVAKRTSRETSAQAALTAARDAVGSTIEQIALAVKRYWRADGQDPKLESDIASLFDALDLRLDVLFAHAIPIVLPEVVRARIDGLTQVIDRPELDTKAPLTPLSTRVDDPVPLPRNMLPAESGVT